MSDYQLTRQINQDSVQTTERIREAARDAFTLDAARPRVKGLPPLQIVTTDHYNTKWAVMAIEWLRRRHVADHLLNGLSNPRRICIEVLESGMLPRGRFLFYNGVGGALADMITHLIQPLRALTGHATVKELLAVLSIVRIQRARYSMPDEWLSEAFGPNSVGRAALEATLAKDTDTFGLIKLEFTGPPWNGTPVYIRTGKGFVPQSKVIVVEGYDDDGPAALICDIENRHIRMAVASPQPGDSSRLGRTGTQADAGPSSRLPDRVWLQTQEIEVPGLVRGRPLSTRASEYVEIFSALCDGQSPDSRYFPPVEDAAYACDFFYRALLNDRASYPRGLEERETYQADYAGEEVRRWLVEEAGWS